MSRYFKLFAICCLIIPAFCFADEKPSFAISEHLTAGDKVKLYFADHDPGHPGYQLRLSNGVELTYGDIIALGDLYGVVGQPISQGRNDDDRQTRFLGAFESFAHRTSSINELKALVNVIHEEQTLVTNGLQHGEDPEKLYDSIGDEIGRQLNCITGGSCMASVWWMYPGRYLQLARENFDHFNDNAWLAYLAGHHAAINEAIAAHLQQDPVRLEQAYAMNALACHFLSDRFATGHLRTPRVQLSEKTKPNVAGAILSSYMHNEENQTGLHVHNRRGDRWMGYGDQSYFNAHNQRNRELMQEALQLSANQIFTAYLTGVAPDDDAVLQIIPETDEMGVTDKTDVAPLFIWDEGKQQLLRRKNMSDLYDRHWTSDWWAWSTLMELKKERGIMTEGLAMLAQSDQREQAIQDDLLPPM